MKSFKKILYVSQGLREENTGLAQALALLNENNQVQMTVLIVYPRFPNELIEYSASYGKSLIENMEKVIQTVITDQQYNHIRYSNQIAIQIESVTPASVYIVQQVLRDAFDLVIKEAEPIEEERGFRSLDMDLLRKCPCPIWLCRPMQHLREKMGIVCAIDPADDTPENIHLSITLLQLASALAIEFKVKVDILSCWDYLLESSLTNSAFVHVSTIEVQKIVQKVQSEHLKSLEGLISKANLHCTYEVNHIRGQPDKVIPDFIKQNKTDLLVMGTVARTGIPGFFIGNTAENVLQSIGCSLLAVKPQGFVSPIKA